jgi:hypothetical protein
MGQGDNENSKSLNVENQEKSQIYLVELIFVYPLVITADIVDWLSITGIGVPISWMVGGLSMGVTSMWLLWKGRRVEWNVVANFLDLIPVLSLLPIKTIALTVLLLSEKSKKFQSVMEVAKKASVSKDQGKIINISAKENIRDKVA